MFLIGLGDRVLAYICITVPQDEAHSTVLHNLVISLLSKPSLALALLYDGSDKCEQEHM